MTNDMSVGKPGKVLTAFTLPMLPGNLFQQLYNMVDSIVLGNYEGADALQQPAGRVGNPMDIANMVLFLCSEKAGFITGENICIDGGMTRQMIYHNDFGWTLQGGKKE